MTHYTSVFEVSYCQGIAVFKNNWDEDTLHRLLDLQCATNSGCGGPNFFENLPFVDRGSLPDPEELYFAEETRLHRSTTPDFEEIAASTVEDAPLPKEELVGSSGDEEAVLAEEDPVDEEEAVVAAEEVEPDQAFSAEPSTWHRGCPAEQLWAAHSDVLRTPAAYSAMICGAARFGGADRAWELAEEAGSMALSLAAYNDLLRCAHACSDARDNAWPRVLRGFKLLRASKLAPNAQTFASALYTLSQNCLKQLNQGETPADYADKALGLVDEARRLGIQPTMGVYANLLRTVLNSRVRRSTLAYRMNDLLADVLNDLETRWKANNPPPPCRADVFTLDDYDFAGAAMFCATLDDSPLYIQLAQRVYDLFHKDGDRRFLFRSSLEARRFYMRYLYAKLRAPGPSDQSEVDVVKATQTLYHQHRQVVLSNQRTRLAIIKKLKSANSTWADLFAKAREGQSLDAAQLSDAQAANSLALTTLADIIFDYIAMAARLPPRLPMSISNALLTFSFIDPWPQVSILGQAPLRAISEEGAKSASLTAKAFCEVISLQEPRISPVQFPVSSPELTSIIRMSLFITAFNASEAQTVSQREANDQAHSNAMDLLLAGQRHGKFTDVGATEILRSCWYTSGKQLTPRVWNLLEYLSGMKYLTSRFLQHPFLGELMQILDVAEQSLRLPSAASAYSQQTDSRMVSGRTETDAETFNRLQVIIALRRKISDSQLDKAPQT
ncbi:unnamed protein product [Mesocestoides corti]|uniref:Uncharacterized protein n=2 Tax=Mesocestoides corti TaxID=53468 RepID=A0A0R3UB78_MESCO|nr:unnamed protein product [Mesocestoides corti]